MNSFEKFERGEEINNLLMMFSGGYTRRDIFRFWPIYIHDQFFGIIYDEFVQKATGRILDYDRPGYVYPTFKKTITFRVPDEYLKYNSTTDARAIICDVQDYCPHLICGHAFAKRDPALMHTYISWEIIHLNRDKFETDEKFIQIVDEIFESGAFFHKSWDEAK